MASQSPPRIAAVDGMRGIAALAVLTLHCWSAAGRPVWNTDGGLSITPLVATGYVGVDFFFVISGFVLFLPTCQRRGDLGSLRSFALRRAARILPLYWVTLAVLVVALPLLTTDPDAFEQRGWNVLLHLTFLQHTLGTALGFEQGFVVNGVVWTLTLEVAYYLLLVLVARRFYRHPVVWASLFLAVSLLWRYVATHVAAPADDRAPEAPTLLGIVLTTQLPTYLPHFALGMLAAWVYVRIDATTIDRTTGRAISAVMVLGIVALLWEWHRLGVERLSGTAGPYAQQTATLGVTAAFTLVLFCAVLAPRGTQSLFANPALRFLGTVSYGIYLWHCLVIGFLMTAIGQQIGSPVDFARLVAITLPVSVVLAWLSHVLIERPAMRWSHQTKSPSPASSGR